MKIYVSATYRDLQKHRLAALNILRRMGHQPIGMEDYVAEISNMIAGSDEVPALQVNIGFGSDWWMTRLYCSCSLATDLTSIALVVFEAGPSNQADTQPRHFVGTIHPKIVKERLVSQYEQLRRYENAVGESEPASDLHAEVSRRANVWTNIVDPNGSEGCQPVFMTEAHFGAVVVPIPL